MLCSPAACYHSMITLHRSPALFLSPSNEELLFASVLVKDGLPSGNSRGCLLNRSCLWAQGCVWSLLPMQSWTSSWLHQTEPLSACAHVLSYLGEVWIVFFFLMRVLFWSSLLRICAYAFLACSLFVLPLSIGVSTPRVAKLIKVLRPGYAWYVRL